MPDLHYEMCDPCKQENEESALGVDSETDIATALLDGNAAAFLPHSPNDHNVKQVGHV